MIHIDAEIGIIGAGIAGASAAAALSTQRSVLVFEAEAQPGYHATGRSAAYFAPAYGSDLVRVITQASDAFFRAPPTGFSDSPLLRPRPALSVATATQDDALLAMVNEVDSGRRVTGAECVDFVPVLKPAVINAGMLDDTGGDLDVDALLQGFLKACTRGGGQLLCNAPVQRLEHKHGIWEVSTADAMYRVNVLVNAAGAWADTVAQIAGTQALGLIPKRRTAVLVDSPPHDITDWPLVIDIDEQYYFKPEAGQLLLSPADETPSEPMDAHPLEWDAAVAVDRVQQVADIEVARLNHQWAGLRTFAADKNFVVGFDAAAPNFYWLAGQGGYGVQTSPALAELVLHDLCDVTQWLDPALAPKLLSGLRPQRLSQ